LERAAAKPRQNCVATGNQRLPKALCSKQYNWPPMLDRAENYRALAKELIKLAHAATVGDLRSEFLDLAERYDRLADAVEDGPLAAGSHTTD
jgi:hypothetical protein